MNNVFETDSLILTVGKLSGRKLKLILTTQCLSLSLTPCLLSPDVHLYFLDQGRMTNMSRAKSLP